jgi:hypothetical protein
VEFYRAVTQIVGFACIYIVHGARITNHARARHR